MSDPLMTFNTAAKKAFDFFDLITTTGAILEMNKRDAMFNNNSNDIEPSFNVLIQSQDNATYYREQLIKVGLLINKTKAKRGKEILYQKNVELIDKIKILVKDFYEKTHLVHGNDILISMKNMLNYNNYSFFVFEKCYGRSGCIPRTELQPAQNEYRIDNADITRVLNKLCEIKLLERFNESEDSRFACFVFNQILFNQILEFSLKAVDLLDKHGCVG